MKLSAAVLLSIVFASCGLKAQQSLLAANTLRPAGVSYNTQRVTLTRADMTLNAVLMSGLADQTPFYLRMLQTPRAVCTALPSTSSSEATKYAFDHMQFSAAAVRAAFSHENMVKMAQSFRPGQPLPDAPSYVPLTAQQKFDSFLRKSHSASVGVGIISDTLISQA